MTKMMTQPQQWILLMGFILVGCDAGKRGQAAKVPVDFSPIAAHQGTLDPRDLGVRKFVFETTLPPGKVMVLRWTKLMEGRPPEVRELVQANTYTAVREVLLLYESAMFPFNPDPDRPSMTLVKLGGYQYRLPMRTHCTDSTSADELDLHFSNKERWIFKCFVEDYRSVKARIPKLPAAPTNGGWGFTSDVLPNPP